MRTRKIQCVVAEFMVSVCETVRLYEDFILNIYKNDINVNQ